MEEITIDIDRFIEIIEAEVGEPVFEDEHLGEKIKYYKPIRGKGPVSVALGSPKITNYTARGLMRQLKIDEVIIQAFYHDVKQADRA